MIYMTRIQNMSFLLLKVNNPSVRHLAWSIGHSVWPRWAPRLAPIGHSIRPPSGTLSGHRWAPHPAPINSKKKNFKKKLLFGCCCRLEKTGNFFFQFSVFNPQDPQDPQDPRAPHASRAKPREEEGFFGLVPLVTHPSSIPLLGGLTPKFLSLSFHSL
jgi:hypothetical protein